jgi:hypothetical protein
VALALWRNGPIGASTFLTVVTENLVCMPTLSAGETDRGNRAAAMQRRSGSQSGECRENPVLARDEIALVHNTNGSDRRQGPTDTKRRGVGIGDEVLRPEESLRCARVLASPRLSIPERPWPAPDEFGSAGTSRQSNTHSTELGEIRYPWHPWYGRPVWIHGAFVKAGQGVYRCSLEQNLEGRLFEIPQWMFDSGACCRVRRAEKPAVECAALQDLKLLLRRARSPARNLVIQAQHPFSPGGADAKITESTEGSSNRIVSPATAESGLAKVAARNQTTDRGTTGATAAPTQPENPDRPSRKGARR